MPEKITIECPFCHEKTINAIYYPSVLQTSVSRAAGRTVTKFYRTKEKYEIISGCSKCGKSLKEVKKKLEGALRDKEKEKKIEERLKQQGLLLGEIKTKI